MKYDWDQNKLIQHDDKNITKVVSIKNDLTNDAITYAKYVGPIFEEALSSVTSLNDYWNNECDQIEKFTL